MEIHFKSRRIFKVLLCTRRIEKWGICFCSKRRNRKWSDEEIEYLLLGLMKYGLSSWTTIAQTWQFQGRTTVDLKDKWRNLVGK